MPDSTAGRTAADFARAAFTRQKVAAKRRGYRPGQEGWKKRKTEPRDEAELSGARHDVRDPVLASRVMKSLFGDMGWQDELSVGSVTARWPEIVGADVAEHARIEKFEDKVLVLRASSTAWANQLVILRSSLMKRLADEVGEGVVEAIHIMPPTGGRSFKRGRYSVPGKGPGDTWG
ncbi:MAG: DciA family protein [Cellulomonadaceae bacterium]|nr:DciA family protein [Cellulomonadaceae bacterium]